MINVTVSNINQAFAKAAKISERIEEFRDALMALDTVELAYMTDYIKAHKKRTDKITSNTGKLEDVLAVDERTNTEYTFGWAIGNIAKLKNEAKHWAALNYGSDHIVGMKVPGNFQSGPATSGASGDAFIFAKGSPLMVPTKGITGINYIEVTTDDLRARVDKLIALLK